MRRDGQESGEKESHTPIVVPNSLNASLYRVGMSKYPLWYKYSKEDKDLEVNVLLQSVIIPILKTISL